MCSNCGVFTGLALVAGRQGGNRGQQSCGTTEERQARLEEGAPEEERLNTFGSKILSPKIYKDGQRKNPLESNTTKALKMILNQ